VLLYPLANFSVGKPAVAGLVFGYGAIPTDRVEAGLSRLHEVMGEADGRDPGREAG
jgi:hypothetical protein